MSEARTPLLEKIESRLKHASQADRMFERPMNWDEAAELVAVLRRFEYATRWVNDISEKGPSDVSNYRLTGIHTNSMKEARVALFGRLALNPRDGGE